MNKSKLLALLALAMALIVMMTSCELLDDILGHKCEHVCEECGKCLDAECAEEVCAEKCPGHVPYIAAPVITVEPAELEIYAGEEIDLMFGVSVSDENDENPTLIIEDDGGFDVDTEGVYTITYKAVNKDGRTATATRKITVLKAKSALVLEVKANLLGDNKWAAGPYLNFANALYQELTGNTVIESRVSGVFHNNTDAPITLTVFGDYGEAAIIDANGVVIEGRDGSAGRLVNAANPIRTASPQGATIVVDGENVPVAANFAKNMTIPAGGYAIVVQTGYAGEGFDADGRGFMAYNVIHTYGNVVSLKWADSGETLTTYQDQAPTIEKNEAIVVGLGDLNFDLGTAVLAGLIAKDDNGTFAADDDVTVEVTVKSNGGFDINKEGTYEIVLTATDGTNVKEVVRVVKVISDTITIEINGTSLTIEKSKWLYNTEVSANTTPKYAVIAFDKNYTGTFATNGYGAALVIDQYGRLVRIYDGANLGFYTAAGKADKAHFTVNDYATVAWSELQDGELLIICPNDGVANASRGWALSLRTGVGKYPSIGHVITLPGFTFEEAPHECAHKCEKCGKCTSDCTDAVCAEKCEGHAHECESKCETCGKCLDAECTEAACAEKCACVPAHECETVCRWCGKCADAACEESACADKCAGHDSSMLVWIGSSKQYEAISGTWLYNTAVETSTAAKYAVLVYDKNFEGTFTTNGYGVAVVLDKYGRIIEVYDGANGGYWLPSGKQASAHFDVNTYATTAWAELEAGETLVIFPNGGSEGNKARQIGLDSRFLFGQKMNLSQVSFPAPTKTISIGSKTFTAAEGKWIYNGEVTTFTAANYAIILLDKNYTGEFSTNGYGVALVLDQYGKIIEVYDGANVGYWVGGTKQASAHFNANTYATTAWAELEEGELLVVLPNGGSEGNAARQVGLDCRFLMGQKLNVSDVTFAIPHECANKCATCGNCTNKDCADKACATKCNCFTVSIGTSKTYTAVDGTWLYNTAVETSTAAKYAVLVYDKNFEGTFTTNGYGVAVVLNQFGKIVEVYDGANVGYWLPSGKQASAHFDVNTYATTAWAELEDGETLVIFPNGGSEGNKARQIGLDSRFLFNQKMNLTGIEFAEPTKTISIGSKTYTAAEGKWIYNGEVTTATAANYAIILLDKNYTGEFSTNGYGVAVVLDQYGKIVKVYDGANGGGYWYTSAGKAAKEGLNTNNYATTAWAELEEGELLVVLPNGGSEGNAARQVGLDCRFLVGQKLNVTGFTFATAE